MATWDTPASSNDIAVTGNLEGLPSILSLVLFLFLSVTHTNRCMLVYSLGLYNSRDALVTVISFQTQSELIGALSVSAKGRFPS